MELRYYNDGEIFYANGKLKEEPEESLEELIKQHEGFEEFSNWFKEEYVDYEEWEQKDSESCMAYGFAEFNGFNAIDMLEYDIDLKIMHINERENQNNR